MNSREAINVYYDGIIARAKELDELADSLLSLVNNNVGESTQNVRQSWTGDSGEIYVRKVNDTAGRLRQRARELQNASASLKSSAERMRNADLIAITILGG